MDDVHPNASITELDALTRAFIERQTARMPLVGYTADNAPLLERYYEELLTVLERYTATDRYVFGSRPSLADFGLYGQLKTLAVDPTARGILRERAPRTEHWVLRLDDASGVDGSWAQEHTDVAQDLVGLAGRYYLPFLAANRAALDAGEDSVTVDLCGHTYRQPVYRYQGKCWDYLQSRYAALDSGARERLAPLLGTSDCQRWFENY